LSTIKANAVTSKTTNTDLTLSANGTGGVKVNDYFVQTKGSDIASATSLTLGKDGNLFDVTGTTTITSIATQGIGSYVTLHFDGALTFTHDSTDLILPGAANITTAAGDIAVMYEYASGDWRCVSYTKASGAAVVAASGVWNIIGTAEASTSSSLAITGLDSTYDTYAIGITDIRPATDGADAWLRLGDSSGIDSGTSDYAWGVHGTRADNASYANIGGEDNADAQIKLTDYTHGTNYMGTGTGEGFGAMLYLSRPGDGAVYPMVAGSVAFMASDTLGTVLNVGGLRLSNITLDRIEFLLSTGDITSGRLTVWGIAHA